MSQLRQKIVCAIILTLCLSVPSRAQSLFDLPPFERAVLCIKHFEGWHDIRRDYPYVGYGHRIQPQDHITRDLTRHEADSLLRSDLRKLLALFRSYGKDSLLLATLAYNVGPYRILGGDKHKKSRLLQKIERGDRHFHSDYLNFCHWHGKVIPSIRNRRRVEWRLLYVQ